MPAPRDAITTAYLKTIWVLQHEEGVRVGVTVLTERVGRAKATVSQTVQALAEARLIRHEPYGPIELTLKGEQLAIAAIRHERMARAFFHRVLGYPWPRVAAEADRLAPVLHRELAERLHRAAGAPEADPFGNPIPGITKPPGVEALPLNRQPADVELLIVRISDTDPALLERFHELGLAPGEHVRVAQVDHATGVVVFRRGDTKQTIGVHAAGKIQVARATAEASPVQGIASTQTASVAARPKASRVP